MKFHDVKLLYICFRKVLFNFYYQKKSFHAIITVIKDIDIESVGIEINILR